MFILVQDQRCFKDVLLNLTCSHIYHFVHKLIKGITLMRLKYILYHLHYTCCRTQINMTILLLAGHLSFTFIYLQNAELLKDARSARFLRDELDILREKV